jgi:hypothetical protein
MARGRNSEQAWATGGRLFAAITLIMLGIWQVLVGIAAIANDELFVVGRDYTYDIDTTAWDWIHLVLGAVAVFAGFLPVRRRHLGPRGRSLLRRAVGDQQLHLPAVRPNLGTDRDRARCIRHLGTSHSGREPDRTTRTSEQANAPTTPERCRSRQTGHPWAGSRTGARRHRDTGTATAAARR